MAQFTKIASGLDVSQAVAQVDAHPEFWSLDPLRIYGDSPHRETSDIWVRYRHPSELVSAKSYREPHLSVWYPAWRALPALRPIVFRLAAMVESVHLGGILITRMPPGSTIYEHDDLGTWHSEYHNAKIWMPLRANDQCLNHCEDETVVMAPGDAWTFSNLLRHSVENRGDTERICLICCFRSEP